MSRTSLRAALLLMAGGLALALSLWVASRVLRHRAPPPVFGVVPAFHLVDERGAPFTDATMRGHASVVDFVFTRCPASCPRLTARMGKLQSDLARDGSTARLVSFSVDPDYDTPEILAAYAEKAGADPRRWSFVTGPADEVIKTVVQGFKVSAAKVARGASDYDVTHGDWFVLVDGQDRIRGYYATDVVDDMDRLLDDVAESATGP